VPRYLFVALSGCNNNNNNNNSSRQRFHRDGLLSRIQSVDVFTLPIHPPAKLAGNHLLLLLCYLLLQWFHHQHQNQHSMSCKCRRERLPTCATCSPTASRTSHWRHTCFQHNHLIQKRHDLKYVSEPCMISYSDSLSHDACTV